MTRAADEARRLDHHPDWCNSWNKVVIDIVDHAAGGITDKCTELATRSTPSRHEAYSPVRPSMASRRRSTWPLWRAVSSIMCSRIHRSVKCVARVAARRPPSAGRATPRPRRPPGSASHDSGVLREQLLGRVVGGRVELPVAVGLPVDGGPGLGLGRDRRSRSVNHESSTRAMCLTSPPMVSDEEGERLLGQLGLRRARRPSTRACRGGSRGRRRACVRSSS